MEGLRVFCYDLAVSPSADACLFCSNADAALWAEDYCDSFKDVQTIGVFFGAFYADAALQQSVSIRAAVQKCFLEQLCDSIKAVPVLCGKFSVWEAYQTDSVVINVFKVGMSSYRIWNS